MTPPRRPKRWTLLLCEASPTSSSRCSGAHADFRYRSNSSTLPKDSRGACALYGQTLVRQQFHELTGISNSVVSVAVSK
jgi:hypothetical protein